MNNKIKCKTKAEANELIKLIAKANYLPQAGRGVHCPNNNCTSTRAEHIFDRRDPEISHIPLLKCLECGHEFLAIGWVVFVDEDDQSMEIDDDGDYLVSDVGLFEGNTLNNNEKQKVKEMMERPRVAGKNNR